MKDPLSLSRIGKMFSKAEKPVLVLIGEVHLPAIQERLVHADKLKVKMKEAHGVKKYVADIRAGGKETRESIRRLLEETIKKEILVLKDEKITRLFLEEPASQGRKMAYSGYMRTHDIKNLKSAIRMEREKESARSFELVKRFLHDSGISKTFFAVCMSYHEAAEEKSAYSVFDLPYANIAHKAGVFDVHPDEGEQEFMEVSSLLEAKSLLLGTLHYIERTWLPFQEIKGKSQAEALKELRSMLKEADRILGNMDKRIAAIHPLREKAVFRTVADGYVPGSAVICGMNHVEPLKKMFSRDFEVKVYRIGEALFGHAK